LTESRESMKFFRSEREKIASAPCYFLHVRVSYPFRLKKGESTLNTRRTLFSSLLITLVLGALTPQFAQDAPAPKPEENQRNRALLIGLMRQINTAEVGESSNYGSFGSWQTLLEHETQYMNGWLRFYSPDPKVHFGQTPEILPGWNLRLNVHADGLGYDVLLEDTTDKSGYAALSDERGVIRECKWLK